MMALGKPVVCYIREQDLRFVPPAMAAELPLIPASSYSLEDNLEAAISRRSEWPAWGRRGREFALRWHHPRRIAQAMIDIYRDPLAPLRLQPPLDGGGVSPAVAPRAGKTTAPSNDVSLGTGRGASLDWSFSSSGKGPE